MTTAVSFDVLAGTIRAEHEQVGIALRHALDHALRAGDLLICAKARLGHGAWLPWLTENCALRERVAQQYMRLSRHREQLEQAYPKPVSDMGVREALALLAEPQPARVAPPPSAPWTAPADWTPEYTAAIRRTVENLSALIDAQMEMSRVTFEAIAGGGSLRGWAAALAVAGVMPEHDGAAYLEHWIRYGAAWLAGEPVPLMGEDEAPGGER